MATNAPAVQVVLRAYNWAATATPDDLYALLVSLPGLYREWWLDLYREAPVHVFVETTLILFVVWLWFIRPTVNPKRMAKAGARLTRAEVDELVEEWQPEPLVKPLDEDERRVADSMLAVDAVEGNYMRIRGVAKPALNLATFDFHGMAQRPELKEASRLALEKYGCGSCGPRGFYGTIDVHLELESAFARFFSVPETISYSDGSSTVASAIPAFAKRGDVIVADEAVAEPVRTGIELSRASVEWFRHNDMADLRRALEAVEDKDRDAGRTSEDRRRFIVVEGLYRNTGSIVPLQRVLELKKRFKYRLVVDESFSFGTLGDSGRGVTQHFGVGVDEVEILTFSMENAIGSVGGVCVGAQPVVDHQRLSGAGYCFSASTPPFLSAAALESLRVLEAEPGLVAVLRARAARLRAGLAGVPGLAVRGDAASPVVHVAVPGAAAGAGAASGADAVEALARRCLDKGVAVAASRYTGAQRELVRQGRLEPTLRFAVSSQLSEAEIDGAVKVVAEAAREMGVRGA